MNVQHDRYLLALSRIDAANAEDPNIELVDGVRRPRELVYAERMSEWLERLRPDASELLRLAVRAQHIRRWEIPRQNYPMDRAGYKRWRTDLAKFHAETAGAILRACGYDEAEVARVQSLLRKQGAVLEPPA